MLRLFIVDDNKYERNGILRSIDWTSLGIEVVGVYANGAEALADMKALQPDIVITDIAMPTMNGIELSERISSLYPRTGIIFISCHSDFEFARSALHLGVHSYVLKPIQSDELIAAVNRLSGELVLLDARRKEKERMLQQIDTMLPMVREQLFRELLLGNFRNTEEIADRMRFLKLSPATGAAIRVMDVRLDGIEGEGEDGAAEAYYAAFAIKEIVLSLAGSARAMHPVQLSESRYAVVAIDGGADFTDDDILEAAVLLHEQISERLKLNATMGISGASRSLADVAALYRQAGKAVSTGFYGGSNPIILYSEIEDVSDNPFGDLPSLESVYDEVRSLVADGGEPEVDRFIAKYLDSRRYIRSESDARSFASLIVNIAGIVLTEANRSFKELFGDDLSVWQKLGRLGTIDDARTFLRRTLAAVQEQLAEREAPSRNARMVEAIKAYVRDKYSEQISIEDIAKSVYLSGRHANGLFKKETGKTIFDYLIEFRIDKARKLLRGSDMKVAAVAEAVGYVNTSYFCLAFKKHMGLTPAE